MCGAGQVMHRAARGSRIGPPDFIGPASPLIRSEWPQRESAQWTGNGERWV